MSNSRVGNEILKKIEKIKVGLNEKSGEKCNPPSGSSNLNFEIKENFMNYRKDYKKQYDTTRFNKENGGIAERQPYRELSSSCFSEIPKCKFMKYWEDKRIDNIFKNRDESQKRHMSRQYLHLDKVGFRPQAEFAFANSGLTMYDNEMKTSIKDRILNLRYSI